MVKISRLISGLAVMVLLSAGSVSAYVAASDNYRLELDSVNFGGLRSTSVNYQLEDTAGESGTGILTSTNYVLYAGYQQMSSVGSITISAPSDVTLLPAIPETGGGTANGSASWTVTTNNPAGYSLAVAAATTPALKSGSNSFDDYLPAGSEPDFTFSVGSTEAVFAFSPEGSHLISRFQDDGAACAITSGDTSEACWDGLSTTPATIAQSNIANAPGGTITTLRLRAAAGESRTQPSGNYTASLTLTATAL